MFSYTGPFIPRADTAFRAFAEQFANGISAHPSWYGMTPAEAKSIMKDFVRFNKAFMVASNPATRTHGTIASKDDARAQLQNTISLYSAHIRANKGIEDSSKIAIGVRPDNVGHTRRRCPNAPPLLNYVGSLPGVDQLVYRHTSTPNSPAKPYGAERLELWAAYSMPGEPKPKKEDARPIGSFKKSKMIVPQDPQRDLRLDAPANAPGTGLPTYWARWVGYDNQPGPWSIACRTTIKANVDANADDAESATESDAGEQPLKIAA